MGYNLIPLIKPRTIPPLDDSFRPAVLWNHAFLDGVRSSKKSVPLPIAIKKEDDSISVHKTQIFSDESKFASSNYFYVEQLVKTLLWIHGGYEIIVGGPKKIGEYIKELHSREGKRSFDVNFMSNIYGKPFSVEISNIGKISSIKEKSIPLGGHFEGCRIGFDLGASDRKVSAVIDGKAVFSLVVT